jgi:GGDEF domain-containing protein
VLVQLDELETLNLRYGMQKVSQLLQDIKQLIHHSVDNTANVSIEPLSSSRLGVILTGADRQEASTIARQVLDGVRKWSDQIPQGSRHLTLSIGLASLAMPPRNFPVSELVQAAERCLNGVQLSGGNGLKSIDIC